MLKTIMVCLSVISGLAIAGFVSVQGAANTTVNKNQTEKLYRHVVLFKFKESATKDDIQEIVDAFGELPTKIKEIHSYEHGTDVSPEGLSKGFTHCFLVTFKTKKDLEVYLPHPAHQAFVKKLKPVLDEPLVVDYWTK